MDDEQRYRITKDVAEMTGSLYRAVVDAGGYPGFDLENMTVMELISLLAPNKIRFFYDKDRNLIGELNE